MLSVLSRCLSRILFALSISALEIPLLIFSSRSLCSMFSFIDGVKVFNISSNLNLMTLVSLSYSSLACSSFLLSSFLFLSTFTSLLSCSMALIRISSCPASSPSLTSIRLSSNLSFQSLAALSLNVWALIIEFS